MKSLYDLLGARENDDADALKKAFRRVVKANHPDLHPGDPDALERFKKIIAAHALLSDAAERARYDRTLQHERQRSQSKVESNQLRPKLARQQIRLKRQQIRLKGMVATAAVAAVGALVGYGLFSAMSTTTGVVAINKDDPVAIAIAAAAKNEDAPTATAAPKADAVKGNAEGSVDNAGKPVKTIGAQVMEPTDAPDQGQPRDKHDGTEIPNAPNKLSADKHEDAEVPNRASKPSADKHEDAKVLNEANNLSDDAATIMRFVTQRLRAGDDAQATAARELALGPPSADKHEDAEVPNGANMPSADKHEDAKVLNEANKPSDDADAIVMQRLRDGSDAQATAGRELALGPPAADKHEDAEVPNGANMPSADKHEDAKVPNGANKPSADKHEDAKVLNEANNLSDDAATIMRFVMERLRDGGDAQATAGRELALGPPANDASFYRQRGIAAYGSGDFLGAIGNFDEAIRLNPNDAQSYNIRGNVWDELGILERALADYAESIRIDPNNPAVFHDRAILWQRKGALDKALVDLDSATRFSFSDVHIYCDRGLVWYEKGRHDRAVADFDHAIKLDPDAAAACIKRGLIVHRNGEFTLATLNQAIRVDPSIFDALRPSISRP